MRLAGGVDHHPQCRAAIGASGLSMTCLSPSQLGETAAGIDARHRTVTINAAAVLLGGDDPQRTAIVCDGGRLTYGELQDAVARAAADWQRRGLAPGDRVAVKLPDGIAWVTAFLGAIWAGGVAVGVNPRLAATEWATILGEGGFRWILAESRDGTLATYHDKVVTARRLEARDCGSGACRADADGRGSARVLGPLVGDVGQDPRPSCIRSASRCIASASRPRS